MDFQSPDNSRSFSLILGVKPALNGSAGQGAGDVLLSQPQGMRGVLVPTPGAWWFSWGHVEADRTPSSHLHASLPACPPVQEDTELPCSCWRLLVQQILPFLSLWMLMVLEGGWRSTPGATNPHWLHWDQCPELWVFLRDRAAELLMDCPISTDAISPDWPLIRWVFIHLRIRFCENTSRTHLQRRGKFSHSHMFPM